MGNLALLAVIMIFIGLLVVKLADVAGAFS
jgi:hypothetical protein